MSYKPEFGDAVLAYAKKYLAKNAWRTRPEFELDDLLQEAYILFVRLVARYEFENPRHFMSMWKRALHNGVVNLARRRTRRGEVSLEFGASIPARRDSLLAEIDWNTDVAEAPPLVKQLVSRVLGASGKGRKPSRTKLVGGGRETTNAFLCHRAGIRYDARLRPQFESWLGGERVN